MHHRPAQTQRPIVSADGVQFREALLRQAHGSPVQPPGTGSQLDAGEDGVSTQMRFSDESPPQAQEGRGSDGDAAAAEHEPAAQGSPARHGRVFGSHLHPGWPRQLDSSARPAQLAGVAADAVAERTPLAEALHPQSAAQSRPMQARTAPG